VMEVQGDVASWGDTIARCSAIRLRGKEEDVHGAYLFERRRTWATWWAAHGRLDGLDL
jgi:hypothetical protein